MLSEMQNALTQEEASIAAMSSVSANEHIWLVRWQRSSTWCVRLLHKGDGDVSLFQESCQAIETSVQRTICEPKPMHIEYF